MTTNPQANIAEYAAQQIEQMPQYLDVNAIAQIIENWHGATQKNQGAAEDIVKGILPLFEAMAAHIRSQPVDEIGEILTLRDKFVQELTLNKVKERCYSLIRNNTKKPRKNFSPIVRKGIWWEELEKVLEELRSAPGSLESHINGVWQNGYDAAVKKIADKLRLVNARFDPGDGAGVRIRQPTDYADLVEKMKP